VQTIEVQYRPGDRVHVVPWESAATVSAVVVQDASATYMVSGTGPDPLKAAGWFTADQLEPLVINGKELTP
jgi:hypothetical protein